MITFLLFLLIALSILMVLVVLVQRGRGGGLSGAFGSGGGSNSAFGTKTGDVFTTITVILFVAFLLLSIALSFKFRGSSPIVVTTEPAVTVPDANDIKFPATGTAPATSPVEAPRTAPASLPATTSVSVTRPASASAPK